MVVSVVQKGYTLQKRLIRPAMVTVGGGAPAPAAEEASEAGEAEAEGEETPPEN